MSDIKVIYSSFTSVVHNDNGGVIFISGSKELSVSFCVFHSCSVTDSTFRGGSIYFSSNKNLFMKNTCAFLNRAKDGYFLYSYSTLENVLVTVNKTTTNECKGKERACLYIYQNSFLGRSLNSTHCHSDIHCNIQVWVGLYTNTKYVQFYKNEQDVIYGVNSHGSNHTLSHALFISNTYTTNNKYGYIHTNSFSDEILNVYDLFVYGNKYTIFWPNMGTIKVHSFQGDSFSKNGPGTLIGDFTPDPINAIFTTIMKEKMDCLDFRIISSYKFKPNSLLNSSVMLSLFLSIFSLTV